MKCIIGLGNIGKEYEHTRHNTGFVCLDALASKYGIDVNTKMKKSVVGQGEINGEKIVLVKPTTYMNLSGEAAIEVISWYKIDTGDVYIIYDDVDLKLGVIRYRESGSAGTHNGMKSVISLVGTEIIKRIRVGIENRDANDYKIDLANYVLGKYSKEELLKLNEEIIPKVIQAIEDKM